MKIIVSGNNQEVEDGISVSGLMVVMGIDPQRVAVMRNNQVVKKTEYETVVLSDGDSIEMLTFAAGG